MRRLHATLLLLTLPPRRQRRFEVLPAIHATHDPDDSDDPDHVHL